MPADYRNRRNEIRNNRQQDAMGRRALNASRRQERIARRDHALLQENNVANNIAPSGQPTASNSEEIYSRASIVYPIIIYTRPIRRLDVPSIESREDQDGSNYEEQDDYYTDELQPRLTDSDIDKHTEYFTFQMDEKGFCAIDQEDIEHGDSCRRIKQCGHEFHAERLAMWLRIKATCPLCKARLAPSPAPPAPLGRAGPSGDAARRREGLGRMLQQLEFSREQIRQQQQLQAQQRYNRVLHHYSRRMRRIFAYPRWAESEASDAEDPLLPAAPAPASPAAIRAAAAVAAAEEQEQEQEQEEQEEGQKQEQVVEEEEEQVQEEQDQEQEQEQEADLAVREDGEPGNVRLRARLDLHRNGANRQPSSIAAAAAAAAAAHQHGATRMLIAIEERRSERATGRDSDAVAINLAGDGAAAVEGAGGRRRRGGGGGGNGRVSGMREEPGEEGGGGAWAGPVFAGSRTEATRIESGPRTEAFAAGSGPTATTATPPSLAPSGNPPPAVSAAASGAAADACPSEEAAAVGQAGDVLPEPSESANAAPAAVAPAAANIGSGDLADARRPLTDAPRPFDGEVEIAARWWASRMRRDDLSPENLATFERALRTAMEARCDGHWYPSEPLRGSGHRSVGNDLTVDPALASAAADARICDVAARLPRAVLWINPGGVRVRVDGEQAAQAVYPEPGLAEEL